MVILTTCIMVHFTISVNVHFGKGGDGGIKIPSWYGTVFKKQIYKLILSALIQDFLSSVLGDLYNRSQILLAGKIRRHLFDQDHADGSVD